MGWGWTCPRDQEGQGLSSSQRAFQSAPCCPQGAGPTFSVMSLSQESMLSRNRSSVLPLLLLKLLLCMSCLQGWREASLDAEGPLGTEVQVWAPSTPGKGMCTRTPSQAAALTQPGERCLTSELKRSSSSEEGRWLLRPSEPLIHTSSFLLHQNPSTQGFEPVAAR